MSAPPVQLIGRLVDMVKHAVAVFQAKETPLYVKIILGCGLLYVLSPWDLIPEWVPGLGVIDDFALAALLITWANTFRVSGKK